MCCLCFISVFKCIFHIFRTMEICWILPPLSYASSGPQSSVTLLPDCKCFVSLEDTRPHNPWAPAKVSRLSYRVWSGSRWSSQRYIWVSDFLKWSTKLNSATELLSLWFPLAKREKSVTTLKSQISFQPAISKEIFLKQEATGIHSWGQVHFFSVSPGLSHCK